MQQQEVEYEYAVYNLPLPSDVPVTILTMGKSLLHKAVDLELPLNTTGKYNLWDWPALHHAALTYNMALRFWCMCKH